MFKNSIYQLLFSMFLTSYIGIFDVENSLLLKARHVYSIFETNAKKCTKSITSFILISIKQHLELSQSFPLRPFQLARPGFCLHTSFSSWLLEPLSCFQRIPTKEKAVKQSLSLP